MKKLLAMMVSVLMACSVMTACGEKDDDKEEKKDNKTSVSEKDDKDEKNKTNLADIDIDVALTDDASAPFGETVGDEIEANNDFASCFNVLDGAEEYTIDIGIFYDYAGTMVEMPMVVTSNGTDAYCSVNVMGMEVTALAKDGVVYGIDNTNQVYYADDSLTIDDMNMSDSMGLSAFTDAFGTITESNKVTLGGIEFERYGAADENGDMGYAYVVDGAVKYIASVSAEGGMYLEINELSDEFSSELVVLPEGYEEVTLEEYYELVYGEDAVIEDEADAE